MSTTGTKILRGRPSWMREASPDDPIYKRGLIIGEPHLFGFSKNTKGPDSEGGNGKASMEPTGTERTGSPEPRASSRDSEDGPGVRELKAQVRRYYPDIDEDLLDSMMF